MKIPSENSIARGVRYCIENAEKYIHAAEILLKNGTERESYLMTLYSLEEMGKIILIWNVLSHFDSEKEQTRWLKRFHDHGEKFQFAKDLDDIAEKKLPLGKNRAERNKSFEKQNIAYVNIVNGNFNLPRSVKLIDAKNLLKEAVKKISSLKRRHTSIEEDEKWIKQAKELKGLSLTQIIEKCKNLGMQDLTE